MIVNHSSLDPLVDFGISLIALPQAEGQTSNAEFLDHILDKILATTVPQVSELAGYP